MEVPNSLTLLIGLMAISGAKKIILFGVDGYKGKHEDNLQSFYKPELQKQERILAEGGENRTGIVQDTSNFENKFMRHYKAYCVRYSVDPPTEIINCSPISIYKIFKKVNYDEIKEYLS